MKNKFFVILMFINLTRLIIAQAPAEFQFNQSSEQCFYFIQSAELDGEALSENDWIGAFNGDVCVGSTQWQGEYTTIAVMGDDGFSYSNGYCENGDIPTFKVWDADTGLIWQFTSHSSIHEWTSNGTFVIDYLNAFSSSPRIELSTNSLSFGNVVVNQTASRQFYIKNIGEETLTGTILSPICFSVSSQRDSINFNISSNDSLLITVNFSPQTETAYHDSLEINSNATNNPLLFLPVSGTGIKAHIHSTPELLEFGNVWINHSVQKELTISNNGTSTLFVSNIVTTETCYTFSPNNFSVEPENEQIVTVTFLPTSIKNYDTQITFVSNIEDYNVTLHGNGYLLQSDFITTPDSVEIGNSVQFFNNSTGDIISYLWNFGDGETSNEENPIHIYSQIGIYSVTLTVYDQYFSTSAQKDFVVYGVPEIALSTDEIDFENTYLGVTTIPQTLTIYSTRTKNLVITAITFKENTGSFNFISPIFPFSIPPGDSEKISITFTPNTAGIITDSLQIHNISNEPIVSCKLQGTGVEVPPKKVENLHIQLSGNNVILTWNEVTQTILNTPANVSYYKIEASSTPYGPFVWIGTSQTNSFIHINVGEYTNRYFYQVIAVVDTN